MKMSTNAFSYESLSHFIRRAMFSFFLPTTLHISKYHLPILNINPETQSIWWVYSLLLIWVILWSSKDSFRIHLTLSPCTTFVPWQHCSHNSQNDHFFEVNSAISLCGLPQASHHLTHYPSELVYFLFTCSSHRKLFDIPKVSKQLLIQRSHFLVLCFKRHWG